MFASQVVALLAVVLPMVAAQGAFLCTAALGGPDPTVCAAVLPGSECVQAENTGRFFCGIAGASCADATACDFGSCSNTNTAPGICVGGFGTPCLVGGVASDLVCIGTIYCVNDPTASGFGTCGGGGAFCQDSFACAGGNCDLATNTCTVSVIAPVPSGAIVARRRNVAVTCSLGFTSCPLQGGKSECVDTSSSLERCGGCRTTPTDGADCTEIEGAESVACVEGVCVVGA